LLDACFGHAHPAYTLRHVGKRVAIGVVLALLGSAGAACSFLLDTDVEQCTPDAGCSGKFAGMACVNRVCVTSEAAVDAGPWGCLGDVTFPPPPQGNVNVVVPLIDLTSQKPVTAADVFARLCAKIDVNCNSPLSSGDAGIILSPDANGLLHLTFPAGFDGFALIDPVLPDGGAPSDAGDAAPPIVFVPSLVFFNPPIDHDLVYSTIVMVKTSELVQIATIEQTPIDPSLGAVFMETVDCNAKPASGVSVTLDSQTSTTQGFYFENGLPKLNASSTDVTGYAGFVNAPLGTRSVTGTLQATQQRIGTATVFTRPSTISYTTMAPSP
jgi:hypothetical protein